MDYEFITESDGYFIRYVLTPWNLGLMLEKRELEIEDDPMCLPDYRTKGWFLCPKNWEAA